MTKKSFISFSFFFFFVVLFLGLSLSINNSKNRSIEEVQIDLQHKILNFSQELKSNIQTLHHTLNEKGIEEFKSQALQNGNKSMAFYLFKNHQLIFWTNNHILIPDVDSLFDVELACKKIGPHWVLSRAEEDATYSILGLKILKVDYSLHNEFLHDTFLESYGIETDLQLSNQKGTHNIISADGKFLFSFHFPKQPVRQKQMPIVLFFSFLLAYIFFLFCLDTGLKQSLLLELKSSSKIVIFSLLSALYLIVFIQFRFPSVLFQSPLFQPQLYSNLNLHASLGSLFLVGLWLFSTVVYLNANLKTKTVSYFSSRIIQALRLSLVFIGITSLYYGLYLLLRSLIFDSQVNLEITAITNLNFYSYTVIVLIMLLQITWFLISKKLLQFVLLRIENKLFYVVVAFFIALIFAYLPLQTVSIKQFNQIFLFLFFLSIFYLTNKKIPIRFWTIVYFLFLFISISGAYYTILSNQKEEAFRKTGLASFLLKNDPLLENDFLKERQRLLGDSLLADQLRDSSLSFDALTAEIKKNYFRDASKNYEISMVFCDQQSQLLLMPENTETPCYPFFEERIRQASDTIKDQVLYLVDQHFRTKNYIGIINFKEGKNKIKLFVEFLSKYQPKELGIPALLSNAKNWDLHFFNNYSYAYYYKGALNEWFGKYDYKQNLDSYGQNILKSESYFSFEKYSHFVYVQDNDNVLIVSKPDISWLKQFASLAFLFLFYSLNIAGLMLFLFLSQNFSSFNVGFQSRLQFNMLAILLFSFIAIGISSLYYLHYLNNEKNKSVLTEKAHSVLIELEHKLQDIDTDSENQKAYIESLLIKFSQVFFTDINLYDLHGNLIASSRPQLFDSELLSRRINPKAFYNLGEQKSSLFMHKEQIGLQEFYSVYLPFRSVDDQPMAYLNLPYFARQNELEEEISGFLVAYLNIYMILILLALSLTILISNYLFKPLKLLKEKIQKVKLESTNEKIEWGREDEIGALILEYNRMVDELAESAHKLAFSQRESAWREMAQQIAHEIKNPLTPMKLNIQFLEKAWKEGGQDFDQKISRIAKNLTEQIDSLSDIASQFSSFAAVDQLNIEKIELKALIINIVGLFSGHKTIHFETSLPKEEVHIMADRNQFVRILNNLIKNAIQSMFNKSEGRISVHLADLGESVEIRISDNGCGIPENEKKHIFEPRFTTKTSGMGLGLALVKKMVENAKGKIRFESKENRGTHFIIRIPKTSKS